MNTNTFLIILIILGIGFGIYFLNGNKAERSGNSNDSEPYSDSNDSGTGLETPGGAVQSVSIAPVPESDSGLETSGGAVQPVSIAPVPESDSGSDSNNNVSNKKEKTESQQNRADVETILNNKAGELSEMEKINRQTKKIEEVSLEPNNLTKKINKRQNITAKKSEKFEKNIQNGRFEGNKFINQ